MPRYAAKAAMLICTRSGVFKEERVTCADLRDHWLGIMSKMAAFLIWRTVDVMSVARAVLAPGGHFGAGRAQFTDAAISTHLAHIWPSVKCENTDLRFDGLKRAHCAKTAGALGSCWWPQIGLYAACGVCGEEISCA